MAHNPETVVHKSVTVKRNMADAFRIWTEQIHLWWPAGHSRSGDPQTRIVIDGQVGGRFYEQASSGEEFDFGSVIVWEPPHRLEFTWFLGSSPEMPTRVHIQFTPLSTNETLVEVNHRGPELIGELWWQRVKIFNGSWEKILAAFHQG